jgi:hypothetical protein
LPSPHVLIKASASRALFFAALAILLVVGVRLSLLRQVTFCGVPDSCSYLSLAETLGSRHVFQAQYADNLQLDHVALPATGIEYWRPGTSFFILLSRPFGQVTLHSGLIVTLFAGLLTALAAWKIVMRFNQDRGLAAISVLLCFTFPIVWTLSLSADSGLYYAGSVAWFLALFTVRFQGYLADAIALCCVAIAYLVRNDAVILVIPLCAVLLLRYRTGRLQSIPPAGASLRYCAFVVAGFFAALVPMHVIDYLVLGKAFPSASSRVLFFNDLSDIGRYGDLVNLHSWISVGIGSLIKLRIVTFPSIIYHSFFILMGFGVIFIPLLMLRRRADGSRIEMPEIAGGLTFFITVLAVYGFVLPAIGASSALRTLGGLLPLAAVLIFVAIRNFVPGRAAGVLSWALITFYLISGVMYGKNVAENFNRDGDRERLYGEFLHTHGVNPETARLITDGPDQMYVTNGYHSIQLPSNGIDAIAQLALDLHATHVLVDTSSSGVSQAQLDSRLHPLAIDNIPASSVILLTLPVNP